MERRADKRDIQKIKVIWLVLSVMAATMVGTILFYRFHYIVEYQVIPMDLEIRERVGFVLDNDALHFGTTYPGGSAQREVWFINNYTFPVKVGITTYGQLGSHVKVAENNFLLEPATRKMIIFTATAPEDLVNITIEGTAKVLFTRG